MALNRFDIIGRLTKDPEMKSTPGGTMILTLNLAQTKRWKDANGEKQEKSLFFQFKAFGKQGEILQQYTAKGSKIYISAVVEPWEMESQDGGGKKYGTSFIVRDFEFLDSKKKEEGPAKITEKDLSSTFGEDEIAIEDIPF